LNHADFDSNIFYSGCAMKKLSGADIRSLFLSYFEQKGHRVVPSSSLVPASDPTLLFTNAGMNQFKGIFLGEEVRDYKRATTAQKCVRAGGKHNDLENVGYTTRHHTFFEMLGNFSFGDYFKEKAIEYAWELITVQYGVDPQRLWITIFDTDDDADLLWQKVAGVSPSRIVRMGEKDNFWSMGDTGPCGPCSEIHIDLGPDHGCRRPECKLGCECDRFIELWNLVFMQYNRDASGTMTPLPAPSIDTGMGLERMAAVLQGVNDNYESDLLRGIIDFTAKMAGIGNIHDPVVKGSLRVVADHLRAMTFLIADGVLPSNIGRGYVLRRIMRRAMRHGKRLGFEQPFLFDAAKAVVQEMGEAYPYLREKSGFVAQIIKGEEARFSQTLGRGLKLLEQAMESLPENGELPGEVVFRLYDTYGFPVDLTEDVARGRNLRLDKLGFEREMERQRELSSGKLPGSQEINDVYRQLFDEVGETYFEGYESLDGRGRVLALIREHKRVESARAGDTVEICTHATPFYGEAGGQLGDQGEICLNGSRILISDTKKYFNGLIIHHGQVETGDIRVGDEVTLRVDGSLRQATRLNHTATHLLQKALQTVLGDHVRQLGSLVAPNRLRFDFAHFAPVKADEIARIEAMVNGQILENLAVETRVMELDEAKASGAMALFDEKYDPIVRVVSVGNFSQELCGGTHVRATGEIGLIKIVAESSIASGIRRIEALTGLNALAHFATLEGELLAIGQSLKGTPGQILEKVEKLLLRQKELEQELEKLQAKVALQLTDELLQSARDIQGIKVIAARVGLKNVKDLRALSDTLRVKLGSGIFLIAAEVEGKLMLLIGVTDDLTKRFQAGKLIQEVAKVVGGSGGGKPNLAQAGGTMPEKFEEAKALFYALIEAA
jgi:alanyl-tRNA synthetase